MGLKIDYERLTTLSKLQSKTIMSNGLFEEILLLILHCYFWCLSSVIKNLAAKDGIFQWLSLVCNGHSQNSYLNWLNDIHSILLFISDCLNCLLYVSFAIEYEIAIWVWLSYLFCKGPYYVWWQNHALHLNWLTW